jgi:lantibiotic transport system ATP-binding protein
MGEAAIETSGLGKRYGAHWTLRDLDLRVEPGAIYGFLGRNGAGKTSAIRLILGLLRPTTGAVRVFGHDVATDRLAAARRIGSLVESRATYDQLTGRENLEMTRTLLGLPRAEVDRVLEIVDMRADAGRKAGHYSLGMRQRLGLARALLGRPSLLVLDEPMNGLDPAGMRDMRRVIRQMPEHQGVTVFLSSHLLAEVEQTVTHIGLLHQGVLMAQGPIGEQLASVSSELVIRAGDLSAAAGVLRAAGYAPSPAAADGRLVLQDIGDPEAAAINRRLIEAGVEVVELSHGRPSLETLFARLAQMNEEAA